MSEIYLPLVSSGSGTDPQPDPTPIPTRQRIVIDPLTRIEGHLRIEAQVDQGVELDCRFRAAKARPGKERQTQVDGGGIQRIQGFV